MNWSMSIVQALCVQKFTLRAQISPLYSVHKTYGEQIREDWLRKRRARDSI